MKNLLLALMLLLFAMPAWAEDSPKESTYDRVMRTGTIRCGYALWNPVLIKDIKTGNFSGFSYDLMNEVAKRLSLKIEWTEESGMDTILTGMSSGRYDMVCFPLYMNSIRAKVAYFSSPMYYSLLHVVTRADDHRFDKNFKVLNNPEYSIAVLEGEITALMARQRFPESKPYSIPQIQGYSFVLKDVDIGKADVTFSDSLTVSDYNKANGPKLKILSQPLSVNAVAYPLPQDVNFKEMFDATINETILDGWFENLLDTKYPEYKETIRLLNAPYRE